jgi:hypothetical protein
MINNNYKILFTPTALVCIKELLIGLYADFLNYAKSNWP